MDNFILNRIEEVKKNSFNINIGDIFSRAWDIFSGTAFYVILGLILPSIIAWVINFILGLFISIPSFVVTDTDDFSNLSAQILTPIALFGMGLSFFINAALAPITVSILTIAKKYDEHRNPDFNDLFIHYKDGKFGSIFLAYIAIQIITVIATAFCVIPGVIFLVTSLFIFPFIVFSNLSISEAIKSSFSVLWKNFGQSFLFCLASIGIFIIGGLACLVGLLVAIPLIYIGIYVFYKDVIGFEGGSNEIDQLGNTNDYQSNY